MNLYVPPPEKLVGVVGKTNVGKSTFFAAATLATVQIENRPFVTLEPNVGVGYVKKKCVHLELGLAKCTPRAGYCIRGWRFIPVKLIDIPGLIRGAKKGRGLGNKFLDAIRQADGIILVVDAAGATDEDGNPAPPGTSDPVEEVKVILNEIDEWIYSIVSSNWDRFVRKVTTTGENAIEALTQRLSGLSITRTHIENALRISDLMNKPLQSWSQNDLKAFARALRMSKPIVIAANKCDIPVAEDNIRRLREAYPEIPVVPTSSLAELILRRAARSGVIEYLPGDNDFKIIDSSKLDARQYKVLEYIRSNILSKWGSTGVQEVINTIFLKELKLISVYPVEDINNYADSKGNVLPDAYLVPEGTTARQLAYMIHTDLGKTFLYAINAKTKMRVGENYILRDNDVIKIVAAAAKRG